MAAGLDDFDLVAEAALRQRLLHGLAQGDPAGGMAGGAGADAYLGLGVVGEIGVLVGRGFERRVDLGGAGLAATSVAALTDATSCLRSLRTSLRASVGPMRPKVSSLPTRTTGARAQAPTQLTVCSVKRPSGVVPPMGISSSWLNASTTSGAPATWQAVPMHTSMTYLPTGRSRNWP